MTPQKRTGRVEMEDCGGVTIVFRDASSLSVSDDFVQGLGLMGGELVEATVDNDGEVTDIALLYDGA